MAKHCTICNVDFSDSSTVCSDDSQKVANYTAPAPPVPQDAPAPRVYNPAYTQAECQLNGFFFCTIEQKCLNKPLSGGTCNVGSSGGSSGSGTNIPATPVADVCGKLPLPCPAVMNWPYVVTKSKTYSSNYTAVFVSKYTVQTTVALKGSTATVPSREALDIPGEVIVESTPLVLPTDEHVECDCEIIPNQRPIPVYAEATLMPVIGFGMNMETEYIAEAESLYFGSEKGDCPERDCHQYTIHVNRLTEKVRYNKTINI